MDEEEWVVRKSEEDEVEVLSLRHPPLNLISTGLLDQLDHALEKIEQHHETRAVIITGDGTYFSGGADLKEVAATGLDRGPELLRRGNATFSRIARLPPPVIAAINGLAVGGGLELALACDLRVGGESAKLGLPEVSYGLMPGYGGTQRLSRLIGAAKARELIFSGALISASEALRIGLVNRVVPAGQELRAARDLAHTIAKRAPRAVQAAKRAIVQGLETTLAHGLEVEAREFTSEILSSEDLREGLLAFVEHRPPKFRGT